VELVSTTPAKLFGLYPRKGTIAVGSDADLIVFDPNEEQVISAKTHHMRVDYSMFEGIQIKGVPQTVFSRGRAVIDGGKFVGRPGAGQFIRRQTHTAVR
jgi:dihydropyrimidinase